MNSGPGRQLFFVINQHPLDGSAHALYCFRHCWWLAKTRPGARVNLVFPGRGTATECERHFGLPRLENFSLVGLPAVRRARGGSGITLNLVFYLAATAYLQHHADDGDWLVTASFTKLFRFLTGRKSLRQRCQCVYEAHQLALLDEGRLTARAEEEFRILGRADLVLAMTDTLQSEIRRHVPGSRVARLGLACGFSPEEQPPLQVRAPDSAFTLGYIGSLYTGQGVDWLVENWPKVSAGQPVPLALEIIGGSAKEVAALRAVIARCNIRGITLRGAVPTAELRPHLARLDALVIPSLPVGRLPHVAITKAYDYLGLGRPILAADLPSTTEVIPKAAGYFFRAGEAASLAEALRRLVLDPTEAGRRVTTAAERAARLTWSARATEWWDVAGD